MSQLTKNSRRKIFRAEIAIYTKPEYLKTWRNCLFVARMRIVKLTNLVVNKNATELKGFGKRSIDYDTRRI